MSDGFQAESPATPSEPKYRREIKYLDQNGGELFDTGFKIYQNVFGWIFGLVDVHRCLGRKTFDRSQNSC